jgi:RNA ligase (TIGR02306 family)
MSKFEVPVVRIRTIEPIAEADSIELAVVGDYRSVVGKGQYKPDQPVVYIPEGSVLPSWLISKLGLEGRLAGSDKNRVKAIKLRGCLSQGLVYPLTYMGDNIYLNVDLAEGVVRDVNIGDDVADLLEITKWDPPVPAYMAGEVCNIRGKTISYDIENIKKYPDIIVDGELVTITEKIHGTNGQLGWIPALEHPDLIRGSGYVASKGLGSQGLVFKNNECNQGNVYVRAANKLTVDGVDIWRRMEILFPDRPVYLIGEVFGRGVQDLTYGQNDIDFRVFDIFVGYPQDGRYLNVDEKISACKKLGVAMVPILYRGPYSRNIADQFRDGKTVIGGTNIREGIVITPNIERVDNTIGRVILKDVSADYLLRKGNVTEFN